LLEVHNDSKGALANAVSPMKAIFKFDEKYLIDFIDGITR
jgi:hypothetical protein